MQESDKCIFAPCVYDCSSARAMEMAGYEALMFSSGEYSLAGSGVVDYGFSGLSDLEWMVGRITATCSLPLTVDIEDGFGGPLAVYRTCKRLARLGAAAVQLEDAGDMEEDPAGGGLRAPHALPRDGGRAHHAGEALHL